MYSEIPFLREMADMEKMRTGKFWASEAKSEFVPGAVQWVAKVTDRDAKGEVKRAPKGIVQGVEEGIPGLRQTLPKK
jgi:hypothetical protein